MPSSSRRIVDMVLKNLAEIGAGQCSITDALISEEPDQEVREILVGLLVLHEDLELERNRRAAATSPSSATSRTKTSC